MLVVVASYIPHAAGVSIDADGHETQVANQFFTETSLLTFPYRYRGTMRR